ncbi:MAG: hypothetical protein BIFFINMI_01902 [Phycisphaerae bacterium]|nr:hypothetical protein [Phycisphaerae bacterium]
MPWSRLARQWLSELLAVVFPHHCTACRAAIAPGDGGLCLACSRQLLDLLDVDYCRRCGQDVGPYALRSGRDGATQVCGQCDDQPLRYRALVRVGPYAEPMEGLIKRFKYGGQQHLGRLLADWMATRLSAQPWIGSVSALTPVPLHWRRRLGRGFNQSQLLAGAIGRRLGIEVRDALTRPVHRPPQASLPRSRRFENVRGVFAVPDPARVIGRTFCLIDDVCTTGATLSEAARTLRNAGAADVYAAVVTVAQPPPPYAGLHSI